MNVGVKLADGIEGEMGSEEERQESSSPVIKWVEQVAKERVANVLIPQVWHSETASVIAVEMAQYGKKGRDWLTCKVMSNKELQSMIWWQRVLKKVTICKRWEHEYDEHWLPRNTTQISKEEASAVRLKKRRARMHEPRPPDIVHEADTPSYPKEMAVQMRAKYKEMCKVLMDDWCHGRKSKVVGKGLWSINPRYS
ncbi:hypothetical protein GGI13_004429 [Coemansia sp. RSA 455]|nr:hypothetical protein GGI13_004429 [Coemansia sp. RSA 455]